LGEGTGAALALPLLDAALALLDEMATFEEAGIASALPITTHVASVNRARQLGGWISVQLRRMDTSAE
jgi:NaMN:DMB phosphoribosyltransferase